MRIAVISDSHGKRDNVKRILLKEQKAEAVIFLGDGEQDINMLKYEFPEKCFYMVRGNCDWGSSLELTGTVTLEGKKILYTHGHTHFVKRSDEEIKYAARNAGTDVVLYGHTHIARNDYEDGLYILNPGSASGYEPSYGVVEIIGDGILTNIVYLSPAR